MPLFKKATAEESAELEALRGTPVVPLLLKMETSVDKTRPDVVNLNPAASEVLTVATDFYNDNYIPNYKPSKASLGEFHENADKAIKSLDYLREYMTGELEYDAEDVAGIDKLKQDIRSATKKSVGKEGTVIFLTYDDALPRERGHQISYLSAVPEAKYLPERIEGIIDYAATHKLALSAAYNTFYKPNGYLMPNLDNLENLSLEELCQMAEIVEKVAVKIMTGEGSELGLTPTKQESVLEDWFERYEKRNGANSLDKFEEFFAEYKETADIIKSVKDKRKRERKEQKRTDTENSQGIHRQSGSVEIATGGEKTLFLEYILTVESITSNPFRIIGLPANCTEKELQRQRAKLTALTNINKKIETVYDFHFFPQIIRNTDSLNSAFSSIENPKNKLVNALFWFTSCGHSDTLAFEFLRSGKLDKASDIWKKVAETPSITHRKISAKNNLLTLTLFNTFAENGISSTVFNWAIESRLELLESDYFEQFSELVLNRKEKINPEEIAKQFLTMLVSNLEKYFSYNKVQSGISIDISEVIRVCNQCSPEIKEHYLNQLAASPEIKVENALEEIKNRLNEDLESSISLGEELYRRTRKELNALKAILGRSSIRYEMLADKISREMLDSAFEYFDLNRENPNLNPSWRTMRLFHRAKSIAVSETLKDRFEQHISGLQGGMDEKLENEKRIWLENEVQKLVNILDNFQKRTVSSRNALQLAEQSRPILRGIGGFLGFDNKEYLKLSGAVVRQSVGMVAKSLEQQELSYLVSPHSILRASVSDAIRLHKLLDTFDMDAETRTWFKKNDAELSQIINFVIKSESIKAKRVEPESNPIFVFVDFVGRHPLVMIGVITSTILISCSLFEFIGSSNNTRNLANSAANRSNSYTNNSNVNSYANNSNLKPSNSPIKNIKIARPENGQSISLPDKRRGYGVLVVNNGSGKDAVAKLVNTTTGKTYRQVYIRSYSNFKITGISQGVYELKFSLGYGFSSDLQKFTSDETFERFDEKLDFTTKSDSTGIRWKNYTATLNPVANGTATTSSISADDFKDK